ncbi:MAG: DHH family phosphoesterase [Desulfobulbaceae bacterium]|nr:DHH family phosphoesterase [Desulfobulbaceae bacterium]
MQSDRQVLQGINCYAFNGDADGLCALQQLRLHQAIELPVLPRLITGVKRDVGLLARISEVQGRRIAVLDISLDKNREALQRLLTNANRVIYIDHHYSGKIPASSLLQTHIDPSPQTCTAFLVNQLLQGQFTAWALVGAFGDNLILQAKTLAKQLGVDSSSCEQLQQLGTLLNYNSYGETIEDLHVDPIELSCEMRPYADPLHFLHQSALVPLIRVGYQEDSQHLRVCTAQEIFKGGRFFMLPDTAWARRISGIFANHCAVEKPYCAHAIAQQQRDGTLRISVRAPLKSPMGADTLCRIFPGGGGRAAAAGINNLPAPELDRFLAVFRQHFSSIHPNAPDRE